MYAYYFIGGFFEQQSSGGGIHPSAQCHGDSSFGHRCCISISYNMKGDEIASSLASSLRSELRLTLAMTGGRAITGSPCPR